MTKITLSAETFTIALDKLDRDHANVRLTDREADVAALAENIAREGLLQNLGVRAQLGEDGEPTGRYGVVIGGRRLAALQLLAKAKRLAKTAPILCAFVADKAVTSAGLAENVHRVAMHPADAYLAFAKLGREGMREKHIAARFGITPLTVQRRMRLGRLSPVLLDALRASGITEAEAQAYAITTDHEAQERVYSQFASHGWSTPQAIRAKLTEGEVPANDRRARFVGAAAYEAAGGTVRRDLFSADQEGFSFTNPALLDKLALAKLETEAARLRAEEGWQDVRASLHRPDDAYHHVAAQAAEVPLSDKDNAALDALRGELESLDAQSTDDGLTDAESARADAILLEIETMQDRQHSFSDDTKARGRVFVFLGYTGMEAIYAMPRVDATADAGTDPDESGYATDDEGEHDEEADNEAGAQAPSALEEPAGLSAALAAELCAQRTAAVQAQVAQRPDLALRLLVQTLLLDKARQPWGGVAKLIVRESSLRYACPGIEDTKGRRLLATLHDEQARRTPGDSLALLPWLLELTNAEVLAILAPLVTGSIDAGHGDWTRTGEATLGAQAAAAAGLDMRAYWEATPESYFGRVSKAQIAKDVQEGGGGPLRLDDTKAALAATAARQIGAKGWLPTMLRLPAATADAAPDAPDDDAGPGRPGRCQRRRQPVRASRRVSPRGRASTLPPSAAPGQLAVAARNRNVADAQSSAVSDAD